jgi:hypothetical protein
MRRKAGTTEIDEIGSPRKLLAASGFHLNSRYGE